MFKIELINHKSFKAAFESISTIVDEIVLLIEKDNLSLRALTRDHIMFVTMKLDQKFFDEFQCDTPEKIFVDATQFYKMLKKAKPEDILELTANDSELIITLKGKATRRFKLGFMDFSYDNPQPPKIENPCNIRMSSSLLKTYIDDMADFDHKLTFFVDQDYLKIISEGQMGTGEIEYIHGENIRETVKSHFSVPRLQEMLKASKFSEECVLSIGEDNPLILRFDSIANDGYMTYLLAPRLDESEE